VPEPAAENVRARVALQDVVAGGADDQVRAGGARDPVGPVLPEQPVVAGTAEHAVRPSPADQRCGVRGRRSQRVRPRRAVHGYPGGRWSGSEQDGERGGHERAHGGGGQGAGANATRSTRAPAQGATLRPCSATISDLPARSRRPDRIEIVRAGLCGR
jgi:hypothetical protein